MFITESIHQPVLNQVAPVVGEEQPATVTPSVALSLGNTQTKIPARIKTPEKTNSQPIAEPVRETCIITIEGKKYDVISFRSQHSGGDVFKCGTDMTSSFFG